ncbi:sulfotransferase family cytosolic 1B member 1-like [Orbicella faveolata]|uniref:sulfotransferase family cytosolic 1B member 1-like n=1 Tax=Orbicella faveolata TaxID=48498 RepID=UPI0009E60072|nr:sulfotransferase family cytosolic 1B member 1-like [Orbicella faveolata]
MRELLWQIHNDGAISEENIGSRVFWFENHPVLRKREPENPESSPDSKPVIELLPSPRLLSTHLPYEVIPKGKDDTTTCKYIYIARNPKDAAVSIYHFLLFFPEMGEFTWDLGVKLFLQGRRECLLR